ncbi:DnaD domain protein [Dehalobacter sp. 14DCB1]|uniref:DnaD domain-containing protein n=1 Tax=Dehalobacter sp. 14DCB1 TaxID=2070227 RepID=UPI001FA9F646|nr:DnaD domain protein [Dehalobacter sp. 14DCB1]
MVALSKNKVYGGFCQALLFSGSVSIPNLILDHYTELGIGHKEMMLMIHMMTETSTNSDRIEEQITKKMGLSVEEYKIMIQNLQTRGLLSVNSRKAKNRTNREYDFSGLIDQLLELWGINEFKQMAAGSGSKGKQSTENMPDLSLAKLTSIFEQELGRPLTGLECEHIEKWLMASYSEELIIEALRRGVGAGIRSFRYLDSILREWEKKGIKTRLEVEAEDQNFQSRQNRKSVKPLKGSPKIKSKYDNIYL